MGNAIRKNLIYFIYFDGRLNFYHKLNLGKLCMYWHLFDGDIVIKIAVNNRSVNLKPLLALLPKGAGEHVDVVMNNRQEGESLHFLNALSQVSGGITFYAHCKGVTRPFMKGLITWINKLYDENLQGLPELNGYLFSGICGKLLNCAPHVPYDFHYSGSFYWFDTDKVKKRMHLVEGHDKYFTECFPAIIAKQSECLFNYHYSNKNTNYYLEKTWKEIENGFD